MENNLQATNNLNNFNYFFSYWIFILYVLYKANIIDYNPKLLLLLALTEHIILILIMIFNKSNNNTIIKLTIVNIIFYILPYYSIKTNSDFTSSFILFLLYNIWLLVNNQNLLNLYSKISLNIINDKPVAVTLNNDYKIII